MYVLDLFSGHKGWSSSFYDHGHEVLTVDWDGALNPDWCVDIRDVRPSAFTRRPDLVLASPPCECFTVNTIGRNWHHDHTPKSWRAAAAYNLLHHTVWLIQKLEPRWFIIENPMGKMRKLPIMQQFERRHVTWCQYGGRTQKPTDLWGGFPETLRLKAPCKPGSSCHVAAPRGSGSGVNKYSRMSTRHKIPYELSDAVRIACESALTRL